MGVSTSLVVPELHETVVKENGVMDLEPVASLEIPAEEAEENGHDEHNEQDDADAPQEHGGHEHGTILLVIAVPAPDSCLPARAPVKYIII